jgi:hypothetical protein
VRLVWLNSEKGYVAAKTCRLKKPLNYGSGDNYLDTHRMGRKELPFGIHDVVRFKVLILQYNKKSLEILKTRYVFIVTTLSAHVIQ